MEAEGKKVMWGPGLRNEDRQGMDSPLESLEEPHCQHLDFIRLIYKTFQTYDHQILKKCVGLPR